MQRFVMIGHYKIPYFGGMSGSSIPVDEILDTQTGVIYTTCKGYNGPMNITPMLQPNGQPLYLDMRKIEKVKSTIYTMGKYRYNDWCNRDVEWTLDDLYAQLHTDKKK